MICSKVRATLLNEILPTTVVGSYPQPDWLIDRAKLGAKVPRVREPEIWRIAPPLLEEAQNDATLLAIRDMERAGIDIITDGEMRRESYSNRFATALDGIDIEQPRHHHQPQRQADPGAACRRADTPARRGRSARREFLRKNTSRRIKITLPGPFTMAQQAQDDYYKDEEALAMAFAAAVNEEIRDLKAAGADVMQIDEPWLQARPERAVTLRRQGDQPRAAGHRRNHRGAPVLRLCRGGEGQADRLFIPAAARGTPARRRSPSKPRSRASTFRF